MVAVSFAQVPFRDGFDITRHAFSFLLVGPGGWLQMLNYLAAGSRYVIAGFGLRRNLGGPTGGTAQILATTLGAGLVVAGLFPPPPSCGYPPGAPPAAPDQISATAILHGIPPARCRATSIFSPVAPWAPETPVTRWPCRK
jgi:hypothetical protein